jgi:hypothetical protein
LLIDACEWVGSGDDVGEGDGTSVNELVRNTGWLDISAADGEVSFNVKIICHSSDGSKIYYIDDLLVRGSRLSKVIPTYVSGSPTCADEDGNCGGVDYTDSGINWNCTDPGNQEFYFTRTWKSVDLCGKESATQQQLIRVGEEPFFATLPKDTILDFCNNDPTINSPLASDLPCDGAVSVEWIVTREIPLNDGNDTIPGVGSGNVSGFEFPMPTVDEDSTYIIIWTLTDDAQITNTYTQQVKILKPIDVTISPSPYDFCSKETATLTLSKTGGTGSYLSLEPGAAIGGAVTITPDGSWDNGAKQYTTNLLDLSGVVDISVHVEDVNALIEGVNVVGGCTSTDFPLSDFVFSHGTDFTIRTLISTGAISREP